MTKYICPDCDETFELIGEVMKHREATNHSPHIVKHKSRPESGENERSWCSRCGERMEYHATAEYDGEKHWICPVEARAVDDEEPQEQLGAFANAE
ncbi:hypothetical protein [Halorussus salinus]|uniref:hypothetical protein n=1 Tax=Halorussus salinus TaxID=1364935 RepID=UPI0010924E15|nr:hypothetical protein [Halorussus salinus]